MKRVSGAIAVVAMLATAPFIADTSAASARAVEAPRAGTTLGILTLPTIAVEQRLLVGIGDTTLARGLGLMPGTGMPGNVGNAVIAGHRTSHGAPLLRIDRLKVGDPIYFTSSGRASVRYEFRVTKRQIVKADALWITRPTKNPTLTIFACHPPHSIAFRFVIFARLVNPPARTPA